MKTRVSKAIVRLTVAGILAGSMIGIAGPAQAYTSEHVLLAPQTGAPAGELGLSSPGDPSVVVSRGWVYGGVNTQAAKDCYWFKGRLYCITYG
jgi:hypothetical protein